MASISERHGRLYFDFRYRGVRCREYTALEDNRANRSRMEATLRKITAEITLGSFDSAASFPAAPKLPGSLDAVRIPASSRPHFHALYRLGLNRRPLSGERVTKSPLPTS